MHVSKYVVTAWKGGDADAFRPAVISSRQSAQLALVSMYASRTALQTAQGRKPADASVRRLSETVTAAAGSVPVFGRDTLQDEYMDLDAPQCAQIGLPDKLATWDNLRCRILAAATLFCIAAVSVRRAAVSEDNSLGGSIRSRRE